MQNVQNAAEIQQKVINLVELYRTKVGKESKIAKAAKQVHAEWLQTYCSYSDLIGKEKEEDWFRHLMVNEQLLGHFYSVLAGDNADKLVLNELFAEQYDECVFSKEEELFLRSHFKEMVNYIIQTPCNDIQSLGRHDGKDALTIPREVIELIKSRVNIPSGSKVYNPFAGYGQFAIAYPESHFYCDDHLLFSDEDNNYLKEEKNLQNWPYAWLKLSLFANQIDADVAHSHIKEYDAVISYLDLVPDNDNIIGDWITEKIIDAYNLLRNGGKMILLCPNSLCWGRDNFPNLEYGKMSRKELLVGWWRKIQHEFRHAIFSDGSLLEIVQLPQVMSSNTMRNDYSILIIEKGRYAGEVTMIDARFASKESDRKNFRKVLDLKAFGAMLMNQGYDVETGLRKMVKVPANDIHEDLLIPQTYVVEKPTENEKPVPLSSLCQLVTDRVKDVKYDLPLYTPLVTATNLTTTFNGILDLKNVDKANCPNIPPHTGEYTFDKEGNFVDDPKHYIFDEGTEKDLKVAEYRQSKFLDGSKDAVLLALTREIPKMALFRSTGNPIAVETHPILGNKYFHVICPKDGVDAMHLFAILRTPIVYRQLQAYEEFGLYGEKGYLKDILVPTDKRIIHDEMQRLYREQDVYQAQEVKLATKKTEYINEVRMRKHDMRPHMKQLNSAKNLMRYYVNKMENNDDVRQNLDRQLIRFSDALCHLSDLIDNLSDEEKFGKPERFSLTDYFERMITESIHNGEILSFRVDSDAIGCFFTKQINDFREHMKADVEKKDKNILKEQFSFHQLSYVNISPLDFDRMVQNIIENARKHGFIDPARDDYMIWINLSIDEKRDMYIIDFMNNGTPLPEGMSKDRYGIKGEKAGLTGGTGSGGYIVKSTVTHFGGDYDIFCKDGITTVRILLPIATV